MSEITFYAVGPIGLGVDRPSFVYNSESLGGMYRSDGKIFISSALLDADSGKVARHEMLHAIRHDHGGPHDSLDFYVHCKGLVVGAVIGDTATHS